MSRLILGSSSPRRLAILKQLHVFPDICEAADIDETPRRKEKADAYCLRVALEKNQVIAERYPTDFIITADTTCVVGQRIIGKANDSNEAEQFIRLLSGRSHEIITAVVARSPNGKYSSRINKSRVTVKRLSSDEIKWYLTSGEWQDRAGAYHFTGLFSRFIKKINGSDTAILGLPAFDTIQLLNGLGYKAS